jgi:hypothetical protein
MNLRELCDFLFEVALWFGLTVLIAGSIILFVYGFIVGGLPVLLLALFGIIVINLIFK